ncbi:MAG: glycosyltransferase family 4 protein [Gammaproteobacteria bacterium]|nr:glycosyltransferase family 4 protein [Gammaproteobacteria bacterium]
MKVLVLAPHPYYQERGTPIAVDMLLNVLSDRGDEVDLLTYHEGRDREYPRLRVFRTPKMLGLSNVRPGISFKKIVCDILFFFSMLSRLARVRYDVIHAVEESAFMAMLTKPFTSTPYIADMDSLLSAQVIDRYPVLKNCGALLRWMESLPIRYACMVVPMCDALADDIRAYRSDDSIVVLCDVSLLRSNGTDAAPSLLRDELNLQGFVVMYIGNLEPYQGIDLLLGAFKLAQAQSGSLSLLVVGGRVDDIEKYRTMVGDLGLGGTVHFLGPRGVDEIGHYMSQADTLVSPRTQGINTPMKIYSYLDSGVPVLATDLPTHTQVLNDDISLLVEPDERSFSSGLLKLEADASLCRKLSANAKEYVKREHSYDKFKETVNGIYARVESFVKHQSDES